MATMTGTTAVKEAIKHRLTPALETLEENTREAKRAILHGRHAAEDFIAETALRVRRHPMSGLAIAAGAGALTGCLIGFALGRRMRG
jgi:ElaB/YqjD/DUF883 family membrane-anchored ribosome-binding protein